MDASPPPSLQHRRIEFHLARKPFSSSFSNNLNNFSNFKLETLNPSSSSSSPFNHHPNSQPPHPSSSSSQASKKHDTSEFFDAAFDLDFGFRIPFRRIGAGLENLGNTCFLNSVIQCLTYTEPLVAYLQSGKHQNTCHVAGFCALCAIQKHVNRALQSTGRILAPKDLVSNLRCISRNFRNARQEDAHEYMIHLLESMHKCCLPSGVPVESAGAYEKSLVHKIFGGRLRSQVKCMQCSHCSDTFDPFLDLSLEIMKADSVYKALMHFTAAEQLDGGEKQYKCERCKQKVRALKQLTVYKAPYVLTVHLKRFRHFAGQKIDKKVHFGSGLNLKPFVSGAYEGELTYTLYGVLVHAGWSTHSGHYYSFVHTSSGLWYSLDDNKVIQVSEKTVMEQKAYMLFYVRDRKNVGPKKAMDVVHKENLITTMRNASSSIPGVKISQISHADMNSKEGIPSGLAVKHIEGLNASEVLAQPNTSKDTSSNNIALEKEMNQKSSSTVSSESSVLRKENSYDGKVHLATKCSGGDLFEKSVKDTASVAGYDDNSKKNLASVEKVSTPECISSLANGLCNKDTHMVSSAAGSKKTDDKNDGKPKTVVQDSAAQLLTQDVIGNIKDGPSDPMSDIHSVSSKPRVQSPSFNGLSRAKSSETTPRQRLMKQILKSKIGMHLSTKMLFGVSLGLRKRKRFRRTKNNSKSVMQQHLLAEDIVLADMGPSTSDSDLVGSFKNFRKRGYNTCVRGEKGTSKNCAMTSNQNFPIVDLNDGHKHNISSTQTVPASCKLSQESTAVFLGTNGKDVNNSCSKEPNFQLENGVSIVSTKALEESAVGSWKGVLSYSEKMESNGQDTFSIGHVLDEWDEEYDRGKRKKVREFKNTFGGPNVFQEAATKKAKLKVKKAKHNHVK